MSRHSISPLTIENNILRKESMMRVAPAVGGIAMGARQWVYVGSRAGNGPSAVEMSAIAAACERVIADVLKPRFLPKIRVTGFNYPVDISGKWHGRNYRFLQRYCSGGTYTLEGEFDSPFTRLEYVSRDPFDISYRRHNDQWWRLHRSVTLNEALRLIEEDGHLHPL